MALAIRLEGLIREQTIPDYAAVARRGRVTRARMTQIMKLLDLAPDLQEQILFLPPSAAPQREKPAADCPPDRLARAAAPVSGTHEPSDMSRDSA